MMACVLWYVGTYDLPSVAQADHDAAGTDPTSINSALQYQNQRNHTWLGSYSGKSSYSTRASKPLPVSQGFYSRWGQLGHLTKLYVLASDIVQTTTLTEKDADKYHLHEKVTIKSQR